MENVLLVSYVMMKIKLWIIILVVDYSNDLVLISLVFLDVTIVFLNIGNRFNSLCLLI